jgi:DNA-binding protein YbaB
MDDRVLTPDDARERLDAWKGRIDKLAADTKAMSDQFQALQVTKKDVDGLVEVTVDSSGSLVALKLSRDIDRSAPEVIAGTIMGTIRDAKAELAARTQEIIADTVGTESPAARAIADQVGAHLLGGTTEPAAAQDDDDVEPASLVQDTDDRPVRRPDPPRAEDDDDNNDLNLWR